MGVGLYALMVALEPIDVLPYAPAVAGTPVPGLATRVLNLVVVAICSTGTAALTSQLISALGAANLRLQELSQQDELTGIYNRRYVMQRLADEIARLKRKLTSIGGVHDSVDSRTSLATTWPRTSCRPTTPGNSACASCPMATCSTPSTRATPPPSPTTSAAPSPARFGRRVIG